MAILGGILVILAIVAAAGAIAYVGDRVGHQVGRRRLTLYGLRPKHTSTLVAVATGMGIALFVTLVALLVSSNVQTAFFHIAQLNDRVNALQAQADDLERQTHDTNVVVNRGQLLFPQSLVLAPATPRAEKEKSLGAFYDAAVAFMNRNLVPQGLKPHKDRASDPAAQTALSKLLDDPNAIAMLARGPIVLLDIADQNLFPNDAIHFSLAPYADRLVFRKNTTIASVEIEGGTAINPQIAYNEVVSQVPRAAVEAGMPYALTPNTAYDLTPADVQRTADTIRRGSGRFFLQVHAAVNVYPHLGGIPVVFVLGRSPR